MMQPCCNPHHINPHRILQHLVSYFASQRNVISCFAATRKFTVVVLPELMHGNYIMLQVFCEVCLDCS